MTTKPKARKVARKDTANPDPVFALIDAHKALVKEWNPLIEKLVNAECEAFETHGIRPVAIEGRQAKEKFAAAKRAGVEWDQRAGLAVLREQEERANAVVHRAAMRMVRTKPTTLAGAAALLTYLVQRDRKYDGSFEDWEFRALKTAAAALTRIGAEAA